MTSNKNPGEGPISTIANYIYWFLISNFLFILMNVPFILVWSASYSQTKFNFNILLILSLLPTGPALTALLSVMGKLIRNKGISVIKDYFTAYKKNFFDGLFYGGIILAVLTIIYTDILYIKAKPGLFFIQVVLLVAGVVIISMAFYIFPIISRFYFKFNEVIRLSLIYSIKKIHITLYNFICIFGIIILISKLPTYFLLFSFSLFCYIIMFNEKNILSQIEETYNKKGNSNE